MPEERNFDRGAGRLGCRSEVRPSGLDGESIVLVGGLEDIDCRVFDAEVVEDVCPEVDETLGLCVAGFAALFGLETARLGNKVHPAVIQLGDELPTCRDDVDFVAVREELEEVVGGAGTAGSFGVALFGPGVDARLAGAEDDDLAEVIHVTDVDAIDERTVQQVAAEQRADAVEHPLLFRVLIDRHQQDAGCKAIEVPEQLFAHLVVEGECGPHGLHLFEGEVHRRCSFQTNHCLTRVNRKSEAKRSEPSDVFRPRAERAS